MLNISSLQEVEIRNDQHVVYIFVTAYVANTAKTGLEHFADWAMRGGKFRDFWNNLVLHVSSFTWQYEEPVRGRSWEKISGPEKTDVFFKILF